jgi:hypothetical protein
VAAAVGVALLVLQQAVAVAARRVLQQVNQRPRHHQVRHSQTGIPLASAAKEKGRALKKASRKDGKKATKQVGRKRTAIVLR